MRAQFDSLLSLLQECRSLAPGLWKVAKRLPNTLPIRYRSAADPLADPWADANSPASISAPTACPLTRGLPPPRSMLPARGGGRAGRPTSKFKCHD